MTSEKKIYYAIFGKGEGKPFHRRWFAITKHTAVRVIVKQMVGKGVP
jgi:hypothetical protein